ncbi:MAG: maleylpyruvate isomerase N-terminal domain-containing protein [Actinomycetota bacterium]
MTDVRLLFATTLVEIGGWLRERGPMLEERFDGPSALAEFSVRGLAGHLLRAMTTVESYLDQPEPEDGETAGGGGIISAAGYYAAVLEPAPDINSEFQRSIRRRAEDAAPGSPGDFPTVWAETTARLQARLAAERPDRLVKVYGDLVLTLDQYLVTRLIELVVHADDLAVSLAVEPPPLPPAATGIVIGTLVEVARIRHGDVAVLRALSRRERDTVEALRVV